ncbi:MAG: hypothetical protein EP330_22845 [Deltaproteobacteria bacterium]|nr:MAG: hypothetical protein EP330_22845 [Deltaproteobacteria bacterium]
MRPALLLALAGCAAPGMHRLQATATPTDVAIPENCPGGCSREQRVQAQTWREVEPVAGEHVRFVVTGDAGVRDRALSTSPVLAEGPLRTAAVAEAVCAGTCDAAVFVGDNLYPAGITTGARGQRDRASFAEFREAWGFMPEAYFILGNHDWGAYPSSLSTVCQMGPCDDIGKPSRARAQRQLDVIRELPATHGDAHFWETELGPVHAVGLDTVYLARRCAGPDVACRGDATADLPLKDALDAMLGREDKPHTVVFGHHPRFGNGEHGSAGSYRDFGPFALDRGEALQAVLDEQVAPRASLYFAGHDHSVQVHDDGAGMLSMVIGAGGKTSPPGVGTQPGMPRSEELAFEAWCRLGFAVVDASPDALSVQVYTLAAPDSHTEGCPELAPARRPTHMAAQAETPDLVLGGPVPGEHDLRCVRWQLDEGRWSERLACSESLEAEAPRDEIEVGRY